MDIASMLLTGLFLLVLYAGYEISRWAVMKSWALGLHLLYKKPRTAIQVYSGDMFDVMAPDPNTVNITDIAHALSNTCRYNGHVRKFYSVAEHCCHLCDYVLETSTGIDVEDAMHALLHDAAEAYVGDMPSPIKQVMTKYLEVEHQVELAIEKSLGFRVSKTDHPWLDNIDKRILADEMKALLMFVRVGYEPLGVKIHGWPPEKAKDEFLIRYNDLKKIMNEITDGKVEYNGA